MRLSEKLREIEEHPNTTYARANVRKMIDHAEALEVVAEAAETHAEMQTPETLMFLTDALDRLREMEHQNGS